MEGFEKGRGMTKSLLVVAQSDSHVEDSGLESGRVAGGLGCQWSEQ